MVDDLISDIRNAVHNDLYYVALFSALAVPDIMGALDSVDGRATGEKYRTWYDTNMNPMEISGEEAYEFRCRMLHEGRTTAKKSMPKIAFQAAEPGGTMHNVGLGSSWIVISIPSFCAEVLRAAERWLNEHRSDPQVAANMQRMVRRRDPDELTGGGWHIQGTSPLIG